MKYLSAAVFTLVVFVSPARAATEDMLAAALKRIEALESKTDRLAEENKQLRSQLHKTSETAPKEQVKYTHAKIVVSAPASTMPSTLPSMPVYPAQEQGTNWQGIYAGINAGYAQGQINSRTNQFGGAPGDYVASAPTYASTDNSYIYSGPVLGGHIGYNHLLFSSVLIGIETEMNYADINNRNQGTFHSMPYNYYTKISSDTSKYLGTENYRTGLNWVGITRARLGYSLGNFMPYLTGGLAYGSISSNYLYTNLQGSQSSPSGGVLSLSYSGLGVGWSAGAGAEYKVADNWSVTGEYLYTQISGVGGYGMNNAISNSTAASSLVYGSVGPFGFHQARVGLNYHTDWLASKPAVTAKY